MPQLPRVPSRELRDYLYDLIEECILSIPPVAPQESIMQVTPQKPETATDLEAKLAADSTRNPS